MTNLFEIDMAIEKLLQDVFDGHGEVSEEVEQMLDELELSQSEKRKNIGLVLLGHSTEAERIKKVAKQLTARAKIHERKAEWLLNWLLGSVKRDDSGKNRWEWPEVVIRKTHGERIEPEFTNTDGEPDYDHIDEAFVKTKEVKSIDKVAAKAAIKTLLEVKGLKLVKTVGVSVKPGPDVEDDS